MQAILADRPLPPSATICPGSNYLPNGNWQVPIGNAKKEDYSLTFCDHCTKNSQHPNRDECLEATTIQEECCCDGPNVLQATLERLSKEMVVEKTSQPAVKPVEKTEEKAVVPSFPLKEAKDLPPCPGSKRGVLSSGYYVFNHVAPEIACFCPLHTHNHIRNHPEHARLFRLLNLTDNRLNCDGHDLAKYIQIELARSKPQTLSTNTNANEISTKVYNALVSSVSEGGCIALQPVLNNVAMILQLQEQDPAAFNSLYDASKIGESWDGGRISTASAIAVALDVKVPDFLAAKPLPLDVYAINKFVETQTGGMIKESVQPRDISNVAAMLISALHLKIQWETPFDEYAARAFTTWGKKQSYVQFMYKQTTFMHLRKDNVQYLWLPCKSPFNTNIYCLIILPTWENRGQLPQLLQQNFEALTAEVQQQKMGDVTVEIPCFNLSTRKSIMRILPKELGLDRPIPSLQGRKVDDVVLEVAFKANETGVEGGAVSKARISRSAGGNKFDANRPFGVVLLRNEVPVFAGIVADFDALEQPRAGAKYY